MQEASGTLWAKLELRALPGLGRPAGVVDAATERQRIRRLERATRSADRLASRGAFGEALVLYEEIASGLTRQNGVRPALGATCPRDTWDRDPALLRESMLAARRSLRVLLERE